jgi:hypothetical protein
MVGKMSEEDLIAIQTYKKVKSVMSDVKLLEHWIDA